MRNFKFAIIETETGWPGTSTTYKAAQWHGSADERFSSMGTATHTMPPVVNGSPIMSCIYSTRQRMSCLTSPGLLGIIFIINWVTTVAIPRPWNNFSGVTIITSKVCWRQSPSLLSAHLHVFGREQSIKSFGYSHWPIKSNDLDVLKIHDKNDYGSIVIGVL